MWIVLPSSDLLGGVCRPCDLTADILSDILSQMRPLCETLGTRPQGSSPSGRIAVDAIAAFADHVVRAQFEDLPGTAIVAAKTFILDTLGVGIAGSSGPMARELASMQETWGRGGAARVWGNGKRLPAPSAAMCNAYQVHNAEFDCVHEEAVVHAMSVVLPAAIAQAERAKGVG